MTRLSRRDFAVAAFTAALPVSAARPKGPLIETSIHFFGEDQQRFPYHKNATYRPPAKTVESYNAFARESKIDHCVIVHSEVYQDDHRYLEYAFQHEPSPGFYKGTCLFDPIDPQTPKRIDQLVKRLPNRICGIRIHEMQSRDQPPTATGPMRDRDMRSAGMRATWKKMADLGLVVQMQSIPAYAPLVAVLASNFRDLNVLIDHVGLPSRGTPIQYEEVVKLARLPRVYMKISSLALASKQPYPYTDTRPLVRRLYDAFGPARLVWGGLGSSMASFQKALSLIDTMFDFASESDRALIRGGNAVKIFGFNA